MLRRLGEKGLLSYQRYRGVSLTPEGRQLALLTIRKHRLWEVFLVQKLGFSWDEVHEVAEELEHVSSPLLVTRLDEFLGCPQLDPHGDPIPREDGAMHRPNQILLADVSPGQQGQLIAVKNTSPLFLQYLNKIGLNLGSNVKVLDKIGFDNSFEISIDNKPATHISAEVSRNLFVTY
jgi:DtxR family Mn-dependent transcriptional regulator